MISEINNPRIRKFIPITVYRLIESKDIIEGIIMVDEDTETLEWVDGVPYLVEII